MGEDKICSSISSAAFFISSVMFFCHEHEIWGGIMLFFSFAISSRR